MKLYSFADKVPKGFTYVVEESIFHHPLHLRLQAPKGWYSFYIINEKSKTIHGCVNFHVEGSAATSHCRSPFGSYLFSESVPRSVLAEFLSFVEIKLKTPPITQVILKNSALLYDPDQVHMLESILEEKLYIVQQEETSALIPITNLTFESILHLSEKKRLRKCRDAGLIFRMEPLEKLRDVYDFLLECRSLKNYNLSMTYDELYRTTTTFPQHFILTTVAHGDTLVAANISIRVNSKVLYNFYHDHSKEYDALSPVVLLNQGLYQYAQKQKIKWIDLGTSQKDGGLNESLLTFKIRLGATPSPKRTYIKFLN